METEKVNWGILGCAAIAQNGVIPGMMQSNNARLYAISGRNSEKTDTFFYKFGFEKKYGDYEDVLRDPQVQVVYIPLPNSLHKPWVLKAAAYGKHILCEKPMGLTVAEVDEMRAVCESQGVLLMEAFAFRHSPQTRRVKELIDSGAIGKPLYLTTHQCVYKGDKSDPRYDIQLGGGATYDLGCYNINVARYIAGGEPCEIVATGTLDPETKVDDSSLVRMKFPSGLLASSYCSFKCGFGSEYTVLGDRGSLKVVGLFNLSGITEIILETDAQRTVEKVVCPDNYRLEVEQFGRCILNGERPFYTLEDTRGNAAVIDEILRQIRK